MRKARPIVCQVMHGLRIGGAEMLVARLVRRLRERFDFRFYCLDELGQLGEALRGEGFPVEVLDRRPGIDWRMPLRLASCMRRDRVELIHAHLYSPFFYARTARLLYPRPAILFTEHGRELPDYPRRKRILANRILIQRRDRIVGVGEAVRQALIVNEGLPPKRVGVLYNGVDLQPYRVPFTERSAVRCEMGVGDDDFVIIQVARLSYIKDHLTALKTMRMLMPREPKARLVIVGEGPEENAIRAGIESLGVGSVVRMMGVRHDVPRLIQAADVFLLTSLNEGIPLTIIEAMGAGLPVVSTSAGGVGEVVVDGVTGLLAPVGDADGLALHLLRLARDDFQRRTFGEAGRSRAFAHFDEEKMLAEYEHLYREMLR